jgi:uncharacterized protein YkwD
MRGTRVNGHNLIMRRLVLLALLVLVAGCGGGDDKESTAPVAKKPSSGGVVEAEPTKGFVGPAIDVDENGANEVGETSPLSPDEDRPTDSEESGVGGGVACASTSATPAGSNLSSISRSILCLLNAERSRAGLPRLRSNARLGRAARSFASLMVQKRFFSHDTPDGRSVLDRVRPTGYIRGSWSLGENIAWGSGALATPRAIVNGWMHSPGHRANIMRGKFRDIGIGVKLGAPGQNLSGGATYVTDFGRNG